MAAWDGPYLLGQFNRMAGRPPADQVTDATKYLWLSEAQNQVIADIAARMPEVLYPVGATPMIDLSAGQGRVFGFGTMADGSPVFPMGKTRIFTSLASVPNGPLTPGFDYLDEGTQIEIPNGRSFAGPLFWRGITPPEDISSTQPPTLQPPPARALITLLAVKNFGQAGNINPDLGVQMTELWARDFPRWMMVYRTQFTGGGALGPLVSNPFTGRYEYAAYLPGTSAGI